MSRFLRQVVVDDQGKPLPNAVGLVYDVDDATRATPLNIYTPSGAPISLNQLVANGDGVLPLFQITERLRGRYLGVGCIRE